MRYAVLTIFIVGFFACRDEINCHRICDRYAECFDEEYDVEGCVEECSAEADKDDDYADDVADCEACIDDRACAESIFPCADECVGIVP